MNPTKGLEIDDPAYFERLAEVEHAHWWSIGMWNLASCWLDRAIGDRRGLVALDVGCGAGATLARLANHPAIAGVVGLDPSPDALNHARRHGDQIARASAIRLPYPSQAFDIVTCFDVLQHLETGEDRLALAEIARVLAPDGVALIRSNGRGWSDKSVRVGTSRPYALGELKERILGAGLIVERATYANCVPSLAQECFGRLGRWAPIGSSQPAHPSAGGLRIQVPSPRRNRLMGRIVGMETRFAGRLGIPLPFGHSTMVLARRGRRETLKLGGHATLDRATRRAGGTR